MPLVMVKCEICDYRLPDSHGQSMAWLKVTIYIYIYSDGFTKNCD